MEIKVLSISIVALSFGAFLFIGCGELSQAEEISLADHFVLSDSPNLPASIEKAMQAIAEVTALVAQDPNRPVYHFRPPAQWMNDINGSIYYEGYYHVMYQHNPYADTWESMHFGHARSTDLVHWQHLPVALWPSHELGEKHCFSGGAAIRPIDGLPMVFYTSIKFDKRNTFREEWAAISRDNMITWEKLESNPVVAHTTADGERFSAQDPFLFVHDDKTWLLSTSFKNRSKQGGLHLYEATDGTLTKWKYRGNFSDHRAPCPNLLKVGNKWVLMLHSKWFIGTVDWENYKFITQKEGPIAYSSSRNARGSNVIVNGPQKRPIFLAWLTRQVRYDEPGRGWAGCMTLPTELFICSDGDLGYRPIVELTDLRGTETVRPAFTVNSETVDIPQMQGDTKELIFEFKPSAKGNSGIRLRRSADGSSAVTISYNKGQLYIKGHGEGNTKVPVKLRPDGSIKLHIYLDRAILEYFVNDGNRYGVQYMHNNIDDTGIEVFSEGTMKVQNLRAWEIIPIW
ncbi:MAG: glycoside hydrolase family 32 protein [Planctomycetota bacterium]